MRSSVEFTEVLLADPTKHSQFFSGNRFPDFPDDFMEPFIQKAEETLQHGHEDKQSLVSHLEAFNPLNLLEIFGRLETFDFINVPNKSAETHVLSTLSAFWKQVSAITASLQERDWKVSPFSEGQKMRADLTFAEPYLRDIDRLEWELLSIAGPSMWIGLSREFLSSEFFSAVIRFVWALKQGKRRIELWRPSIDSLIRRSAAANNGVESEARDADSEENEFSGVKTEVFNDLSLDFETFAIAMIKDRDSRNRLLPGISGADIDS